MNNFKKTKPVTPGRKISPVTAALVLGPIAAGLALGTASKAMAQEGAMLEEVIVTARKRSENLQEVPDTVVALSSGLIERANIKEVRDVTVRIPNVSIEQSLSPTSTFIGVRGIVSTRNGEPAVSMVVDGAQVASASEISQAFHDVEQIEVLKGPQGALYGRNAIGGAVLVTSMGPTDELSGRVSVGAGNSDLVEFDGSIAGPVTDNLGFRLSGSFFDYNGTIENTYLKQLASGAADNGAVSVSNSDSSYADFETNKNYRAQLVWSPSDKATVDFRYSYSDLEAGAYWYRPSIRMETSNNHINFPVGNEVNSVAKRTIDNAILKFDYELDAGTFTSITSFTNTEERYGVPYEGRGSNQMGDVDFLNPTFIERASADLDPADAALLASINTGLGSHNFYEIESLSQELRFTSDADDRFRWTVGAYYLATERDDSIRADQTIPGSLPLSSRLPNGKPGPTDWATTSGLIFDTSNTQDNTAWAVFFSSDFDITDKLTLTAAIRYDEDEREITRLDGPTVNTGGQGVGSSAVAGAECTVGVDGCVSRGFVEKETFSASQPKLSLAYQLNDDLMFYGTAARGFRSGGFNASGALLADTYDEEIVDSYEIGLKSTLLDGRLRLNAAAFYMDYENVQVFEFDGAIFVQSLFNIPESEITGFEASFDWAATETLTLSGGLGLLDSEIKEFDQGVTDRLESELVARTTNTVKLTPDSQKAFDNNFEGNKLVKFPHTSANLSLLWEVPLSLFGGSTLVTLVDYSMTDERYWWIDNTDEQDTVNLFAASIALQFSDNLEAALWCKNCTDETYDSAVEPSEMVLFGGPAKDVSYQARERMYGLKINYRF